MPDAAVAAPSAAPSLEIPRSGTPEYANWRVTGELPQKSESKPAEATAADPSKETPSEPSKAENAPGAEPGKQQEPRRKAGAEDRIRELVARTKQLERDLEDARRPKSTQAEPSPAKSESEQPQSYQDWRKAFKPAEWVQQYAAEHKDASYEDANAAMSDYLSDVRDRFRAQEQQRSQLLEKANKDLSEARTRYPNFDSVATPLVQELLKPDIPQHVFATLNDSPVLADLLFVIGGSEQSRADFLDACRSNPSKALRTALLMEQEIVKELGKGKTAERKENGQFAAKSEEPAPAKRSPESTPKPPLEVGNRGTAPMDETERALKDIERGDPHAVRAWMQAENRKDIARRRGA